MRLQTDIAVVQRLLVKTPRICKSVAWNKIHLSKLACAYYDSSRSDSSGLLWDIETGSCSRLPFAEEVSVASWMETDPHIIMFGTRGNIRLYVNHYIIGENTNRISDLLLLVLLVS